MHRAEDLADVPFLMTELDSSFENPNRQTQTVEIAVFFENAGELSRGQGMIWGDGMS